MSPQYIKLKKKKKAHTLEQKDKRFTQELKNRINKNVLDSFGMKMTK